MNRWAILECPYGARNRLENLFLLWNVVLLGLFGRGYAPPWERIMRKAILGSLVVGIMLAGYGISGEAVGPAQKLIDRVEIVNTPHSVSVVLKDFDRILREHPDLRAFLRFLDDRGRLIDTFHLDYSHAANTGCVVFVKRPGRTYARAVLDFAGADAEGQGGEKEIPEALRSGGRAALTDKTAYIEPGTAFNKTEGEPSILLPDYSKVSEWAIPEAPRAVDIDACRKRVVADFNYPIAGQSAFVTYQTAAPDDPKRKSIYIPVNNDLYDSKTGLYESTFKYMIEIPIDPTWVAEPGDAVIQVPVDKLILHITTEEINVRRLDNQRITGNRKGLLGQTINSRVVDEDGNIYFAMAYRSPIRFNVHKAKWEAPPVNVYDFHLKHKPKMEDLPYAKDEVVGIRTDFSNVIFGHNRRIWVSTCRNAIFGMGNTPGTLCLASVISIPIDHWDDKEKFEAAMRFNAGSYPETEFALWPDYVKREDRRRKLNVMTAEGNRFCLLAYHRNYFWIMEVNDDGSTRNLVPVKTLNGKPIEEFEHSMRWVLRKNEALGLELKVRLEGEKKSRVAFLPTGEYELTDRVPEGARTKPYHYKSTGRLYNRARAYGRIECGKYNLTHYLGMPHVAGSFTLLYDAVARLQSPEYAKGPCKEAVAKMGAASMGPEYYLTSPPDATSEALGNADYPKYYFSRYDCSSENDRAQRSFLTEDLGDITVRLGLSAGMGPYCHRWFRDGNNDVLYYAGYTGIARLPYRLDGKLPDRHQVEKLFGGSGKHLCVDGAPDAYIKWFRDMWPGLGDKVFVTGTNITQRAGTAYSGGLMWFHRGMPNRLYKLSEMSRSFKTAVMTGRLKGVPGGSLSQDIFLKGNYSVTDAETLPEEKRPTDTAPRIFVYSDAGASGVHDLYGFATDLAGDEAVNARDIKVSRNGLYLVLYMSDGSLLTFDIEAGRFVDAVRPPNSPAGFSYFRRGAELLRLPDGTHALALFHTKPAAKDKEPEPATEATFIHVGVGAQGRIDLSPILECTFSEPRAFVGPATLLYDARNDDGSYDLVIGPHFRRPEGAVKIIRDFVPPRNPQGSGPSM